MPGGEKMLKAIASADQDKNQKLDSKELHDVLINLDKGEITRGLNHKIDEIKTVDGIHDATRDLLTKIESSDKNIKLSKDQVLGLQRLHVLLNPNVLFNPDISVQDGSQLNLKKLDKTIDKSKVINNVHYQNVENTIEFEGSPYGFSGWEQGMNDTPIVGSAEVLEGTSTMYFIPFTLDGKLDFSKGTSTTPGSIDVIARGFDGKALPNAEKKVAYMQDGKLVIEKSDVYAQKMKNKEFVEKLNNVTVPGLFLTQLLDTDPGKGNMKVAYLSDAAIIDAVSSGKYGLTKFQKEYDDAIAPFLSLSNGDDRNTKIAEIHKNFLPKYKDYIKENTSSVLVQLPNDVFEVDLNSTLINPISSTKLTIDGKKDQEQVDNYKSLDGGNIIVSIGKEGNTTSWNVYTKKDGTSYGVDNSQKLIDPNAPVVTAEKPKDIIETTDLMKKIDALNTGFMFSGTGAITESNKLGFLVHEKQALKKLAEASTKNDALTKIVDNLSEAAGQTAKSEKQKKLIKDVQTLIDPKLVADGFRGVKSHNSLLDFAGLPELKQTIAETTPKPTNPTNTAAKKPSSAPISAPKQKPSLSVENQEKLKNLNNKINNILPTLRTLVPSVSYSAGIQSFKQHLPDSYGKYFDFIAEVQNKDPSLINGEWVDKSDKTLDDIWFNKFGKLGRGTSEEYHKILNDYKFKSVIEKIYGAASVSGSVGSRDDHINDGYVYFYNHKAIGNKFYYFPTSFLYATYKDKKRELKFSENFEDIVKYAQAGKPNANVKLAENTLGRIV